MKSSTSAYVSFRSIQEEAEYKQKEAEIRTQKKQDFQNIIDDYLGYLRQPNGLSISSRLRNTLTGTFYGMSRKQWHSDFVHLIDRITKLDWDAEEVFKSLRQQQTLEDLSHFLIDYFDKLQKRVDDTDKSEAYYQAMSALKHDIHHVINGHIKRRIVKTDPVPGQHYTYRIAGPEEFKQVVQDEKDTTRWYKENVFKPLAFIVAAINVIVENVIVLSPFLSIIIPISPIVVLATIGIYYGGRFFKNLITGAPNTDLCKEMAMVGIGCALLSIFHIPMLTVLLVSASLSASYYGFNFAKDSFYGLCKQKYLNRFYKVKNPQTGKYDDLSDTQQCILLGLTVLCVVAGICNAALAYTSSLMKQLFSAIVERFLCTFTFFLYTAEFASTIKQKLVIKLSWEKIKNYINSLGWDDEHETKLQWLGRVALEILKCAIALAVMGTVCTIGFYLFWLKSAAMLTAVLGAAPSIIVAAAIVSALYTTIKFFYGLMKVTELEEQIAHSVKETVQPSKPSVEKEIKLNNIQKVTQEKSTTLGVIKSLALSLRASATGEIYGGESPEIDIPGAIGFSAAAGYSGGMYKAPKGDARSNPLPCIKRFSRKP